MKLSVDGKADVEASRGDVERAVDGPHQEGWRIRLTSDDSVSVEAIADADSGYRVAYVEDEERFHSRAAVTADVLKAMLGAFADGDHDWNEACEFVADKPDLASAKVRARAMSEPPPWAIILVAAAFFGTPLLFALPLPEGVAGGWLIAGPMGVMLIAMLANKLLQARRAAAWSQAPGRITKSEVSARHRQKSGEATEVINEPDIEYEFTAKGRTFTGVRISIGEDSGGANTEATLAHYPAGARVSVYYDPSDPVNCVLERDVTPALPLGCAAIAAVVAAVGFGGYWLVAQYWDAVAAYTDKGHGGIAVFAGVAGLVALMLFEGSRFGAKATSTWASVRGKVALSGTERYQARAGKTTVTSYAPVVEYSYRVNGHDYRSRQIKPDESVGGATREEAAATAARYPKDMEVEVHYDPANPAHAALEKPAGIAWWLLGVAGACFAVAVYASGLVG